MIKYTHLSFLLLFLYTISIESIASENQNQNSNSKSLFSNRGENKSFQSQLKELITDSTQICDEAEIPILTRMADLIQSYQVRNGYVGGGASIKTEYRACLYDPETESYAIITNTSWKGSYLKFTKYNFLAVLQVSPVHGAYSLKLLESSTGEKFIPSTETALTIAAGSLLAGGVVWFIVEPISATSFTLPTLFAAPTTALTANAVAAAGTGVFALNQAKELIKSEDDSQEYSLLESQLEPLHDRLSLLIPNRNCRVAYSSAEKDLNNPKEHTLKTLKLYYDEFIQAIEGCEDASNYTALVDQRSRYVELKQNVCEKQIATTKSQYDTQLESLEPNAKLKKIAEAISKLELDIQICRELGVKDLTHHQASYVKTQTSLCNRFYKNHFAKYKDSLGFFFDDKKALAVVQEDIKQFNYDYCPEKMISKYEKLLTNINAKL